LYSGKIRLNRKENEMKVKRCFRNGSSLLGILMILYPGHILSQELQSAINLTRNEHYIAAGNEYKELLQKDPAKGEIYFYYGDNYLQNYFSDTLNIPFKPIADSASMLFNRGIQNDPDNPLNYIGKGEILLLKGNQTEADLNFDKAISFLPSETNKKSQLDKKEQYSLYLALADAYINTQTKDTARVFDLLAKARQLDSKDYEFYLVKGDAYLRLLNSGTAAISCYKNAEALNPKSLRARYRIGELWGRTGMYDNALEAFGEAINIDPDYAPAYRQMGYILSKLGRNEEAKLNFQKYLDLTKENVATRIMYINTLMDLKDYSEAINQTNIILKVDSSKNDFNRALAYSYYETGQYDKGLASIEKFFSSAEPKSIRSNDYAYYGKLLVKNNQDSVGGEMLLKAYALDTGKPELQTEAFMAFIKSKSYDRAMQIQLARMREGKPDANDYMMLSKLFYNLHEWTKVDSVLEIVNKKEPDFIPGYLWRAYALVNLDPDAKQGLAKPVFDTLVEKASVDSVKYNKELKDAYSYLAYYYFLHFIHQKDKSAGIKSMEYCRKVLARDPHDQKAEGILKELTPRIKE